MENEKKRKKSKNWINPAIQFVWKKALHCCNFIFRGIIVYQMLQQKQFDLNFYFIVIISFPPHFKSEFVSAPLCQNECRRKKNRQTDRHTYEQIKLTQCVDG